MAKNQPQTPLVSSVSSTLKKTTNSTQILTPEEVKNKKRDLLEVVTNSLDIFKQNLKNGKVDMSNSLDLERIVKLTLILSGEADSMTGKPNGEQEQTTTVNASDLSISQIESILDNSDPEVKSMFEKLYQGYNAANDTED